MVMPTQLIICGAIKIFIVVLTIIVLILLDPEYTVAYISVNYEIVLIYIISLLTLLHCVVSIIMYAIVYRQKIGERKMISLTNCSITEMVFAGIGIIAWMLICGIGGTISQRTIIETGERFGWIAACAGIVVSLYLTIMALFCLNLMMEKPTLVIYDSYILSSLFLLDLLKLFCYLSFRNKTKENKICLRLTEIHCSKFFLVYSMST
ncbi:DNA-directed RNA polymerase V subunit [Dirofilaria immitis]